MASSEGALPIRSFASANLATPFLDQKCCEHRVEERRNGMQGFSVVAPRNRSPRFTFTLLHLFQGGRGWVQHDVHDEKIGQLF
jgi:hypothetical protein